MSEQVHQVSRVIELELADSLYHGGLIIAVMAELMEMREQLPYADRLVLRLEWTGPSEGIVSEGT